MNLMDGWLLVANALGLVLLHFLWQGAVLGMLYALLRTLGGAAARYRLGMGMLVALLACPVLTALHAWPLAASADPAVAASSGAMMIEAGDSLQRFSLEWMLPWLVAIWLAGVTLLATRALWQWRKLQSLLAEASTPDARWIALTQMLCRRFGLRRPVRLLSSVRAVTPMLMGWFKPAILLPASLLSGFSPQQVELIIAHELAHVRRWDYLANFFQVIVETVLFYHPVVHWIGGEVRNAREECCDDLVLGTSAAGSALPYAHALANLEELRLDLGAMAPALGADGGVLMTRIRRIVGTSQNVQPAPRNQVLMLVLAAAAMLGTAWRTQQNAADFSQAIQRISSQALALVSANGGLALAAPPRLDTPEPVAPAPVLAAASAAEPALIPLPHGQIAPPPIAIPAPTDALRRMSLDGSALSLQLPQAASQTPEETAAAPLQLIAPVYPAHAMLAGIEGNVELSYRVDARGRVVGIRIVSARPSGVFDQAAKAALSAWRFEPGTVAGERVQNFQFTLARAGAADKCQSQTGTLICRHPGD